MTESRPSLARQIAAGIVIAAGAGYVAAVKLTREGASPIATPRLAVLLPHLICATVVPLAPFLSRRLLRGRDFLWMTLFNSIG